MEMQKERPPFVRFDWKEYGTDIEASNREGRPIPKTVPFAFITPAGGHGRDVFEHVAEEWLKNIREKAINGNYNPDWVKRFEMQYEEWKKGNELPREGTPVKTWHAVNKEQQNRLLALGFLVIEDLAAVTDTDIGRIGLDGRYLRDLAKQWLGGKDQAVQVKKIADLEQANRDKDETIKRMQEKLAELEAALPKQKKAA